MAQASPTHCCRPRSARAGSAVGCSRQCLSAGAAAAQPGRGSAARWAPCLRAAAQPARSSRRSEADGRGAGLAHAGLPSFPPHLSGGTAAESSRAGSPDPACPAAPAGIAGVGAGEGALRRAHGHTAPRQWQMIVLVSRTPQTPRPLPKWNQNAALLPCQRVKLLSAVCVTAHGAQRWGIRHQCPCPNGSE